MADSPAIGIRERNRRQLTEEILAAAERHLVAHGPADLSVRAIAREMGMASSAIYRYFPSRDALLTALIIDAFDGLADAVESADVAVVDRGDTLARWRAVGHAMRQWGLANQQRWALIYGTPVQGYVAPQDTIAAVNRATAPLIRLIADSSPIDAEQGETGPDRSIVGRGMLDALADTPVSESAMIDAVGVWAQVIGLITLELFGHLRNVIDDRDAGFDRLLETMATQMNLN